MTFGFHRIALTAIAVLAANTSAHAACTSIATAADFDLIRNRLDGQFCLIKDIDLSGSANVSPIGSELHPFTGAFDGGGHAIRHLTIVNSNRTDVGLFGWIDGGAVRNLRLPGISVRAAHANASVGGVAANVIGDATISQVRISGALKCSGHLCRIGGVAGQIDSGVIRDVAVAASVTGGSGGAVGGVAGQSSGTILRSYASGPVTCGSNCTAGGLVGFFSGEINSSFAVAPVHGGGDGSTGGLAGTGYGNVYYSYSTGSVHDGGNALTASLVGYFGGSASQDFAVGRVVAGSGSTSGGITAAIAQSPARTVDTYWDVNITTQNTSARGVGRTTAQLQAALPVGFAGPWAITKGYSYPFLDSAAMSYVSTLATVVKSPRLYTVLPIEQNESAEYSTAPNFAQRASLAAVYTMIARTVGITDNIGVLKMTPIDQYFWDDTAKVARWTGPVTPHVTLSASAPLAAAAHIDDSNIIGALKAKRVVIIHGTYDAAGGVKAQHWMLATLFTANGSGVTTNLIANDPWTGTQVWIDAATRRVVRPAAFPLANFTIDSYRSVTLN